MNKPAFATVESKYAYCTVQDKGRHGYAGKGVCEGGAMDANALDIANSCLGNKGDEAVLEIGINPFQLRIEGKTRVAVIAGENEVLLNGELINGHILDVKKGDIIQIRQATQFPFRYLAVAGGWKTRSALGSQTTHLALGIESIKFGDVLAFEEPLIKEELPVSKLNYFPAGATLPLIPGPDFHLADTEALASFFKEKKNLDHQISRQAYGFKQQFSGASYPSKFESVGCVPGMVQLTPSGHLYILMRDAQTTGGYLQILYLPAVYLSSLAQRLPGSEVRFELRL